MQWLAWLQGRMNILIPAFSQYVWFADLGNLIYRQELGRMFSTLLLNSETIHICYLG